MYAHITHTDTHTHLASHTAGVWA